MPHPPFLEHFLSNYYVPKIVLKAEATSHKQGMVSTSETDCLTGVTGIEQIIKIPHDK